MHDYVLITPARNEQEYIGKTLESVIRQTIRPQVWIIVSDRSTDETDAIVKSYADRHHFIRHVIVSGDSSRNFGSQVRAINIGYGHLHDLDYRYIGNLDADVSFGEDYYESIMKKFGDDPTLGLAGGFIFEKENGCFKSRSYNNTESVAHAVQLFRRECYEGIGGYKPLPYGGADWYAEIESRMNGWHVQSFPDLAVYHHKIGMQARGFLKESIRQGYMDYSVGSHPLFEMAKCLRRLRQRPYMLASLVRLCTFFYAYCKSQERPVPDQSIQFLRDEQMERLKRAMFRRPVSG